MSTVVESCWHGKISSTEAEHRLMATNKAKAYLVRESDVKSNRFLLSYVSDKDRGLFKHLFVPTLSARKAYSSPNEAFSVMERMILTSEHCGVMFSCLYDQRIMNFQMDLKLILYRKRLNYHCFNLVWFTFVLQPKLRQI